MNNKAKNLILEFVVALLKRDNLTDKERNDLIERAKEIANV